MKETPEIGDHVRCNAHTSGVVRKVGRRANGTRVAAVMTGTRYDNTEIVQWFKVKDLTPLPPPLLREPVTVKVDWKVPPKPGTRPKGFAL